MKNPIKSDYWYNKFWKNRETTYFLDWWIPYYGDIDLYDDQEEYYRRKGFALTGWLAAKGEL